MIVRNHIYLKSFLKAFISFLLFAALISCGGNEKKNEEAEILSESPMLESESVSSLTAAAIESALKTVLEERQLFSSEEVQKLYRELDYTPLWNTSELIAAGYQQLADADEEGLSFSDYHGEELEALLKKEDPTENDLASLEILLTDAVLKYARHLYYGKTDPRNFHGIWGIARDSKDFAEILQEALQKKQIDPALEALKPGHQIYTGLKRSLAEQKEALKKGTQEEFVQIPKGEVIQPGEKDARLPTIAARLKQLGLLEKEDTVRENTYSTKMVAAIKQYQDQKGLAKDGILGNSTIRELNMTEEQRLNQILVNLERWRWYPRDLGQHYFIINIPEYKLAVVKEGDTIREHNVVAGTRARKTPIFTDTLQYIVLNPTWTIPRTIKAQDVIPKAANNPDYIINSNMVVTSPENETLDPHNIDWSSPEAQSYTITQRAGPANPLGRVKIIYPNRYSIYLHDTPAQTLFDRNQRAASSGCVRVENAIDLSSYVVKNQEEWDMEKLKEVISEGKTTQVEITQPIQVHHLYWTAWRDNGKTRFVEDVYGRDKAIAEALNKTD